jgi:hypothetical protein
MLKEIDCAAKFERLSRIPLTHYLLCNVRDRFGKFELRAEQNRSDAPKAVNKDHTTGQPEKLNGGSLGHSLQNVKLIHR